MTGLTCTLRVTGSDPELARVSVRRHQFSVGRPIELDEASPRISALEYALGALAGEVVSGLQVFASRRRVEIDQIEAVIAGDIEHAGAYLEVVGESGPPRIARLHLKVFVAAPDGAPVRQVWADVLDRLPLVCTMRRAVPLEIELIVTS